MMDELSKRLSEAEEKELRAIVAEVEEQLNKSYKLGKQTGFMDGVTLGVFITAMINVIVALI